MQQCHPVPWYFFQAWQLMDMCLEGQACLLQSRLDVQPAA